jgi:putative zinc finger/helix-turn-helix YgiT family protein
MNKITCAACDSEQVKKVRGTYATKYNQVPISIKNVEMYKCSSCGEKFFTPEQARAVSVATKNQVRESQGLLSAEAIIDIRRRLNLSQTDLEKLFGLGAKVVTRWETGRVVQSKTADVALRLLEMRPESVQRLRKTSRRIPAHRLSSRKQRARN